MSAPFRYVQSWPSLETISTEFHCPAGLRARARGVIKRICRFGSAHGERHFEIVFSLNFQRPRPNIMLGNEQQISGVGEQVVVALHTWIRFEAVLQPQREIPEFL